MAKFPGHEVQSTEIAEKVLRRLKFGNKDRKYIKYLVSHHMDKPTEDIINSPKATRRWIQRMTEKGTVPDGWVYESIEFMKADEKAGKVQPDRLDRINRFETQVREAMEYKPPLSRHSLAVSGKDIMGELNIPPSKEVGTILSCLLERVTENPNLNNKADLLKLSHECG